MNPLDPVFIFENMKNLRFSGHETFHCRQQWLFKGVNAYEEHEGQSFFGSDQALIELGVGKNMVRSIQYWLRSMTLTNHEGELTEIAKLLFNINTGDPYLEKEGTIWLLHYLLCSAEHASIYNLVFREYFHDRARETFTKGQLVNFLNRKFQENNNTSESITSKTLDNDIKVFLKSYLPPKQREKSFEDDFSALFIDLDLLREVTSQGEFNEQTYKLHRDVRTSIPEEVFLYAILMESQKGDRVRESGVSFDELNLSVGSIFSMSVDGLEMQIEKICEKFPSYVVYSSNSGVKELQFKKELNPLKLLEDYYA